MNPSRILLLSSLVPLIAAVLAGQTPVSAFGPIPVPDEQVEGPAAKVASNLRQAKLNVRAELAARGTGAHVANMTVPKVWETRTDGSIQVYVFLAAVTDFELGVLKRAGVEIQRTEPTLMKAVLGWATPDVIDRIAALDIVRMVTLPEYAKNNTGSVKSEGVAAMRAAVAHVRGYNGAGVKVGIISDGVAGMNIAATTGDLPSVSLGVADVQVNLAIPSSGAEGTAMLEIVHDVAPGAALAFSPAPTSLDFISSVNWLAYTANCDVICDDIALMDQPFFADGTAALVAQGVAQSGKIYVSAAGNFGQHHVQAPYYGVIGWPPFMGGNPASFHDWDLAGDHSLDITVAASPFAATILNFYLQWDEPWGLASSDYDLFLTNASESVVYAASQNVQPTFGLPFETFAVSVAPTASPLTLKVLVRNNLAVFPRKIELFMYQQGGSAAAVMEYVTGDAIFGHQAAQDVISCGAVDQAVGSPWCSIESFSSRGPSTISLPSPVVRNTPTITGIDGVSVTGAGGFPSPFFGTSAAAPHIAAVCALLKSASPSSTGAQIRSFLTQGAHDCGSPGFDNTYGFGRADVYTSIGIAAPGASFEGQPGLCTTGFPAPVGAIGDCDGVSGNGMGFQAVDTTPNGAGFPTQGSGYARVVAVGPVFGNPPYSGGGNEMYLKLTPMTLRWDFYSVEAPGDAGFNDGMSIDIVAADGTTVLLNLVYADTFSGYNSGSVDGSPCGTSGIDTGSLGPQTLSVPVLPGGAYLRVAVWNGGDNLFASTGCIDVFEPPKIGYVSYWPGTLGIVGSGGPHFGTYAHLITLAPGAYPFGWLYGLDISWPDIDSQIAAGPPFFGTVDHNGAFSWGPIGGLPPLTFYSVLIFLTGPPYNLHSLAWATTYTIP